MLLRLSKNALKMHQRQLMWVLISKGVMQIKSNNLFRTTRPIEKQKRDRDRQKHRNTRRIDAYLICTDMCVCWFSTLENYTVAACLMSNHTTRPLSVTEVTPLTEAGPSSNSINFCQPCFLWLLHWPFGTQCRKTSSTRIPWQVFKSDRKLTFFTASCETFLTPSASAFLIMALYKFLSYIHSLAHMTLVW